MSSYRSYAEQAGHYFGRPHEQMAEGPIESPAAWTGKAMRQTDAWRVRLSDAQADELDTALATARASGKPTDQLVREDFPLPTLGRDIAQWREELDRGRGFLLVSGVPVSRWSDEDAGRAFWCLGLHLGIPGAQNPKGDLLGHVVDTGASAEDPFVRLYATRSNIAYHCDAADVVGLLCLRTAKSGGASRIVSSVSVYNALLERRPDLAARLYEPFLLDIRNEDSSGELRYLPIPPCRHADGVLRTFYHSDYFRSVQRHDDVAPFSEEEQALLDLYEEIAADEDLALDMDLEPGDVQLLSNHTILHARTGYEDHPEPERKRHLLRLWLSLPRGEEEA
ncbi:MAG: TauD/TfdA family dioxygenase [Myxococcota bacterium]|nr:TauD/TfdA family dioxygenase [Myxococcota bacterium]